MQIDEYKAKYLSSIADFIEHELHTIPHEVDEIPVVLMHSDMDLHTMIFSDVPDPRLKAVVDWKLFDYHHFPVALPKFIEVLFSPPTIADTSSAHAESTSGLRSAFWDEIPRRKSLMETPPARIFLDYYRFGLCLKTSRYSRSVVPRRRDGRVGVLMSRLSRRFCIAMGGSGRVLQSCDSATLLLIAIVSRLASFSSNRLFNLIQFGISNIKRDVNSF